ncbi:MAG: hydrogenase expression/formation protein HypE [Bacteroidetes bacterium]|jgi:hydrogenase expression/formation protein HypE|nr:hydrogenase expression/formation protein HypE [Bacteroidota bacterium]MCL5034360.1 hydrogenase expression/formation protein HypE [Bacteroidota bacterium]
MENKQSLNLDNGFACPIPKSDYANILLAHGSGGKMTHQLIEEMFLPQFRNELLDQLHDGAVFTIGEEKVAFSTDSYVVNPIFFPGGNIGELAVNGTVNDIAMCGAKPLYLSAGFIIEEGLPVEDLWKIVLSMKEAAQKAGVLLVTGDTKVVDRGKGDKLFINTSGVGLVAGGVEIGPKRIQAGDKIIVSGEIGLHGIAIMSVREGLDFETVIKSDTAPLNGLVDGMLNAGGEIHALRDPTRGGVATSLNELAQQSGLGLIVDEEAIPIPDDVKGACELLGLDPLYIANEGKLLAFVSARDADVVLDAMRKHPLGERSVVVGEVVDRYHGTVVMNSKIGGTRVVDMLSGEQLPRIC